MLYEFCAENFTLVPAAIAHGAGRVELCDNLARGGTTPSLGVLDHTLAFAHVHGASVMCMVRPRGGDFVYGADELSIMTEDAVLAAERGADGIVLGCLKGVPESYEVDAAATARIIEAAQKAAGTRKLEVTFHMAFDQLDEGRQMAALPLLASLGVTRVLTHGGPAGTPIMDNMPRLRRLVEAAQGVLIVLPGGGITWQNRGEVAAATGAAELHGTKIVRLGEGPEA
ncbi:MAG: copper homeostasis protein CutC [Atopobiaceae bacterium]